MSGIACTYVSATSFTITGTDYTQELMYGRRLTCYCGIDGEKVITIQSSSWNSTVTSVSCLVADSHSLTSNLETFRFGPGVGEYGSVGPRGLDHDLLLNYSASDHFSDTDASTMSGSLQTNIDAKPDTLLELTDTPAAYDDGKYLKSGAAGTTWETVAGGGAGTTQTAFNNVTQSGISNVTHSADADSKRIVQVIELNAAAQGLTNTELDFDLLDESDFVQEDSVSGTDFIDGKILLHDADAGDASWDEEQKIQASDKAADDWFGFSVAIHNDTAIIGAYLEDTGGTNAGAVYIFTRSGTTWTEQQKIQSSDIQAGDRFGNSVSIYNDTAIIGAYLEDTGGTDAGAAYIFTYNEHLDYPTSQPYYVTTSDANQIGMTSVSGVDSCTVTSTAVSGTDIKCLASFDDRVTWEKWSGSAWTTHSGGLSNLQTGNTVSGFEAGFTDLTIYGVTYLDFAFDLSTTDSGLTPEIDQITINYNEGGNYYVADVNDDYTIEHTSDTVTRVTKLSTEASNIKVNVLI